MLDLLGLKKTYFYTLSSHGDVVGSYCINCWFWKSSFSIYCSALRDIGNKNYIISDFRRVK